MLASLSLPARLDTSRARESGIEVDEGYADSLDRAVSVYDVLLLLLCVSKG